MAPMVLELKATFFIERECEQVGISDYLMSYFFACVTLFPSKSKPEGWVLSSFFSKFHSYSWLNL